VRRKEALDGPLFLPPREPEPNPEGCGSLGRAELKRAEKESMTMRQVSGGMLATLGRHMTARKWDSVGSEMREKLPRDRDGLFRLTESKTIDSREMWSGWKQSRVAHITSEPVWQNK